MCESNGQHVLIGPVDQVQVVVIDQIWGIGDALSSVRDVPCRLGLLGLIWAVRNSLACTALATRSGSLQLELVHAAACKPS